MCKAGERERPQVPVTCAVLTRPVYCVYPSLSWSPLRRENHQTAHAFETSTVGVITAAIPLYLASVFGLEYHELLRFEPTVLGGSIVNDKQVHEIARKADQTDGA